MPVLFGVDLADEVAGATGPGLLPVVLTSLDGASEGPRRGRPVLRPHVP